MQRPDETDIPRETEPVVRRRGRLFAPAVMAGSLVLLVSVAYFDIVTGPDFPLSFCYLVPALLVTWFVGRRPGLGMAAVTVGAWFSAEKLGAREYVHADMAYWNAAWRFLLLTLAVDMFSKFKDLSCRLEAMVEARTVIIRRLAVQLMDAEDAERRRIAYDIHDGMGSILTTLKLNLSTPVPEGADGSLSRERKDDAITMVDDLLDRSRTLVFELHLAMLDQFGLVPTVRRYGAQFAQRTRVEVLVSEEGAAQPLPTRIANYLFRSIKEVLNNAAKHGQARQIVVRTYWEATRVRIVVDDDGQGFDTAELTTSDVKRGLGLAGIHERLTALGGTLHLESRRGQGTRVVLESPLAVTEAKA